MRERTDEVVELRVHGVGGAGPEAALGDPHPVLVSGDDDAGFWRPRWPAWGPLGSPPLAGQGAPADPAVLEAFSWGGLTSRTWSRALWVLLLPFALVNAAGWMHPPGPVPEGAMPAQRWNARADAGVAGACAQLLAVTLTITIVLAACTLAMDLVGWQCGGDVDCVGDRPWLRPLGWERGGQPLMADHPGRRAAATAAVPVAVVLALGVLGRRTWRRLESVRPPDADELEGRMPPGPVGLQDPRFWDNDLGVARLQRLHLAAGLAAVASVLGATAAAVGQPAGRAVQAVAGAAILGIAWASTSQRGLRERGAGGAVSVLASAGVPLTGLLLVAGAVLCAAAPALPAEPGPLPGLSALAAGLFAVQLALLLGAGVACAGRRRHAAGDRPMFAGFGTVVVAALGTLAGSSAWAGAATRLADVLGTPVFAGLPPAGSPPQLALPAAYGWGALAFAAVLGLLAATGLGALVRVELVARARTEDVIRRYQETDRGERHGTVSHHELRRRARRVARADALPALSDRADALLGGVVAVALLIALAVGWGAVAAVPLDPRVPRWVWTASTWAVAGVPAVAAILLRVAYGNAVWRRRVGVVWDIATFWPRTVHPFAPPCYAERAVPQLRLRLERAGGGVLLSAHSQGTVLGLAAVLAAPPPVLRRVALLTYGSPLRRWYSRAFPAYVGGGRVPAAARLLADAAARAGRSEGTVRWADACRPTDPIGAPLFGAAGPPGTAQVPVGRDPTALVGAPGDLPPTLLGHSGYRSDDAVDTAARDLAWSVSTTPSVLRLPSEDRTVPPA